MARFENILLDKRGGYRPHAELITIGTELVTGSVINSNASYLGQQLSQLGFVVSNQASCRDEQGAIREALGMALERSDVILVSGGLGPTPDDITREAVADYLGLPLILSKRQYQKIRNHYGRRKKRVPALVKREAYFPANSQPILNPFGIALGFSMEVRGRLVIVLPGVPGELARLFEVQVRRLLVRRYPRLRPPKSLVVKTLGLSEPTIMSRLGPRFFNIGDFQFGIYPEVGEVALRIYADSVRLIKRLERHVARVMREDIYSFSDETLELVIGRRLVKRRWNLGVAESCTGGLLCERLTRIPGSSRYFVGGIVAYENEIKVRHLGVRKGTIAEKGAVSKEVALEMAVGIRQHLGSHLGVAVTGIAGPTGGTSEKPVGLVFIAVASSGRATCWENRFVGDRLQVQERAAKKALEYVWRWIRL